VIQVLGLLGILIGWNLSQRAALRIDSLSMELNRSRGAEALGKWVGEYVADDVLIALSDVGTIPYRSGNPTMDIHPEALADLHIAQYGFSAEYFLDRRPGIAMFAARGFPEQMFRIEHQPLLDDPEFDQSYELIGRMRFSNRSNHDYYVFKLRDLALRDDYESAFPGRLGAGADNPLSPKT